MEFVCNDGMYREDKVCWFIGSNDNILYKMTLPEHEVQSVAVLPKEGTSDYRIHRYCIKYKSKIYCLPFYLSESITVYDINEDKLSQISIPNPGKKDLIVFNAWIVDETLWCVSNGLRQIIEISLTENKVVSTCPIFSNNGEECGPEAVLVDKSIYCVSTKTTTIVEFNTVNKSTKQYKLPVKDIGFGTIAFEGAGFYLTGYQQNIYYWQKERATVEVYNQFPQDFFNQESDVDTPCDFIFYKTLTFKDRVLFVPMNGRNVKSNSILGFHKSKQSIEKVDFSQGLTLNKAGVSWIVAEYVDEDDGIYIWDGKNNVLIRYDINTNESSTEIMKKDAEKDKLFLKKMWDKNSIVIETFNCSLDLFLQEVCTNETSNIEKTEAVGGMIWEAMKDSRK